MKLIPETISRLEENKKPGTEPIQSSITEIKSVQEPKHSKALLEMSKHQLNAQFLIAASRGNEEMVLKLLNMGANIDAINDRGETALHILAEKNNLEMAKLLILKGISLDITAKVILKGLLPTHDIFGPYKPIEIKYTALSFAKTSEMIKLLVFAGADTSIIYEDKNDTYRCKFYEPKFSEMVKEAEIEKINYEYAFLQARQIALIFNKAAEVQVNSFAPDGNAFDTVAELVALTSNTPYTPQAYNNFKNNKLTPTIKENNINITEAKKTGKTQTKRNSPNHDESKEKQGNILGNESKSNQENNFGGLRRGFLL